MSWGVLMAWDTPVNKIELPASYILHDPINITNAFCGMKKVKCCGKKKKPGNHWTKPIVPALFFYQITSSF